MQGHGDNPHIIGFTGSFGSGCSYIIDNILVGDKANGLQGKGYRRLSLSDVLKEMYKKEKKCGEADIKRRDLQKFGDELREKMGAGYLAELVVKEMQESSSTSDSSVKWAIDSIRNPAEIRVLRALSSKFFLFGVFANEDIRWERVKDKYDGDRRLFQEDDKEDKGEASSQHGQRVGDCFSEADVVLKNDNNIQVLGNQNFMDFAGRVGRYADLVAAPLARKQPIREEESLMAMAYAASQRSSCVKRKVGAVIVDKLGNVIASGFNEVPRYSAPCEEEYRKCYRDWLCDDFFRSLKDRVSDVSGHESKLKGVFREKFKILDYCRALHAEENAILSFTANARSTPLNDCTLYTTTYPCRLCANKIATLRIGRIVYLEPYPDPEAKVILRAHGVEEEFFQGVTFKAYFRIYGEEK